MCVPSASGCDAKYRFKICWECEKAANFMSFLFYYILRSYQQILSTYLSHLSQALLFLLLNQATSFSFLKATHFIKYLLWDFVVDGKKM